MDYLKKTIPSGITPNFSSGSQGPQKKDQREVEEKPSSLSKSPLPQETKGGKALTDRDIEEIEKTFVIVERDIPRIVVFQTFPINDQQSRVPPQVNYELTGQDVPAIYPYATDVIADGNCGPFSLITVLFQQALETPSLKQAILNAIDQELKDVGNRNLPASCHDSFRDNDKIKQGLQELRTLLQIPLSIFMTI